MTPSARSWLLAVDVGNSRVKFGLFDLASASDGLPELVESLAVAPDGEVPWSEIGGWLGESTGGGPRGIVAGSNPAARDTVVEAWPGDWLAPRVLTDAAGLVCKLVPPSPGRPGSTGCSTRWRSTG